MILASAVLLIKLDSSNEMCSIAKNWQLLVPNMFPMTMIKITWMITSRERKREWVEAGGAHIGDISADNTTAAGAGVSIWANARLITPVYEVPKMFTRIKITWMITSRERERERVGW